MLRNLIKITIRNFTGQRKYTLINITGLSVSICTSLVIFLFVQHELSYDNFHDKSERIFRIESFSNYNGEETHWATTGGEFLVKLASLFPEIEKSAKICPSSPLIFKKENEWFSEKHVLSADTSFFQIFNFEFIAGDPNQLLIDPHAIIITEAIASKYFGTENPIGRQMHTESKSYTVIGVIKDIPENSHIHFNMVIPLNDRRPAEWVDRNVAWALYSYILIRENVNQPEFFAKVHARAPEIRGFGSPSEWNETIPKGYKPDLKITPLQDIHLRSNAEKEYEPNGDIKTVYIFSTIALLILLIASINYMNLATARSSKRAKEIGLRKVFGTNRVQIYGQFMVESFLMTSASMALSIIGVLLLLPHFNVLVNKTLVFDPFNNLILIVVIFIIVIILSLLSGWYPAIYLSSLNAIDILKSQSNSGTKSSGSHTMRRALVISQFAISIVLIVSSITIFNQLNYITNRNLGFNKEQVLVVEFPRLNGISKLKLIRDELKKINGVSYASASNSIPGRRVPMMPVRIPDLAFIESGANGEDNGVRGIRIIAGDEEMAEVFGLQITEGRDLSEDFSSDAEGGFLLNETAIKYYGLEDDPIGRPFEYLYGLDTPKVGTIVGVVKDFHYASLHDEIEPLMLMVYPNLINYLNIRIDSDNKSQVINQIQLKWKTLIPNIPFNHFFLDDNYNQMYKLDQNLGKVFLLFTSIAIGIACLGLFGLVSFVTEQRTKEIGLRKVLGATIPSIMKLISKEFFILITIAFLLALYPAYYYLSEWLNGFAFRVELNFWVFIYALICALSIAIATVIMQAYGAAKSNPTDALRHE